MDTFRGHLHGHLSGTFRGESLKGAENKGKSTLVGALMGHCSRGATRGPNLAFACSACRPIKHFCQNNSPVHVENWDAATGAFQMGVQELSGRPSWKSAFAAFLDLLWPFSPLSGGPEQCVEIQNLCYKRPFPRISLDLLKSPSLKPHLWNSDEKESLVGFAPGLMNSCFCELALGKQRQRRVCYTPRL